MLNIFLFLFISIITLLLDWSLKKWACVFKSNIKVVIGLVQL